MYGKYLVVSMVKKKSARSIRALASSRAGWATCRYLRTQKKLLFAEKNKILL